MSGHELPNDGETNEWYTPQYITDALGEFDLDPCAAVCRSRDISKHNYTIEDDGLAQPWLGRVWLNPPYGRQAKLWIEKMAEHRNGIVLIFARTETAMFHQFIWPGATGIFFFKGRIKFIKADGTTAGNAGAPSCLISFDEDSSNTNHDVLKTCGLSGKFISLLS